MIPSPTQWGLNDQSRTDRRTVETDGAALSFRFTVTGMVQKGTQDQAIGKSKGGWTTKVLALTDAIGNPVRFRLLPGDRYDTAGVAPLIEGDRV